MSTMRQCFRETKGKGTPPHDVRWPNCSFDPGKLPEQERNVYIRHLVQCTNLCGCSLRGAGCKQLANGALRALLYVISEKVQEMGKTDLENDGLLHAMNYE